MQNKKGDSKLIFYHETGENVLKELGSNASYGLTDEQVLQRKQQYGENRLREKKKKTNLQRFLDQFKDVMILILIGAALISFVIACIEMEPKEFFEPALILLIVVVNAVMGVMQESKAEKALDALKGLSAPHARVIRNGKETILNAADLVPGDIIRQNHAEIDTIPYPQKCRKSAVSGRFFIFRHCGSIGRTASLPG